MKLICAVCKKPIESLIIDKMIAWNECLARFQKHVSIKHPEQVAELQVEVMKAMVSVTTFMLITGLALVKPEEEYIHDLLDGLQKEILYAGGFEPGDEEDEEEGDEEESKPELPEDVPTHKEESDEEELETHVMPKDAA